MEASKSEITVRFAGEIDQLATVEPLWNALQEHHSKLTPNLAELETLSVLPEHRGGGVGTALLESVWERLAEIGVEDLAITAAKTNADSHRFYERHGFTQGFVIYYGRRAAPDVQE